MTTTPPLALVRFLNSDPVASAALDELGTIGSDAVWDRWIWEDNLNSEEIENSQKCAIVLHTIGSWSAPNEYNTAKFPRLQIDIWGDPTRDPSTNAPTTPDAKQKVQDIFDALDPWLHQVTNGWMIWDDLRVISSKRSSEPIYSPIADSGGLLNGGVMGTNYYNLTLG